MSAEVRFRFDGKVAVVTGSARGVGREIVRAFVEAGAQVVAADRDSDGLTETSRAHGARVSAIVADISTTDGAAAIVARATEAFGRLDICVNNAAVAPHAALLEERAEVWDRVYAVNCRGTFLMTQAAARAMIAGGRGGRIINFSSGAAQRGAAGGAAYASSRAATESFSRVAAVELAPHDILVKPTRVLRPSSGGLLIPAIDHTKIGTLVDEGTLLGALVDPVTHETIEEFRAPYPKTALLLLRPTMSRLEGGAMTYVVSEPA